MRAAKNNSHCGESRRRQQRSRPVTLLLLLVSTLWLTACSTVPRQLDTAEVVAAEPVIAPAAPIVAESTSDHTQTTAEPSAPPGLIWDRLRRGFALGRVEHPRISYEIQRLQQSPYAFRALMAEGEPFLHHVLNRVEQAGFPTEIALLPAVESGFQPHVYSPNGAAGLWQFMPATGQSLGLHSDWWFDKRRTVRQSTDAAMRYLAELHQRFDGDWLHALAAYNAGTGTVKRAIRKNRQRGLPTDFWSLDLPGETDMYVPRLLALAQIVSDPAAHRLALPTILDTPYFAMVDTGGQIDLNVAADLAGISVEELFELNAGHRRWTSHPDGPHVLLLPIATVDRFETGLAQLPDDQRLRLERYRIQRGDSLSVIAQRFDVSVGAIQQTNGLRDSRIRAGQHLLIPLSGAAVSVNGRRLPGAEQRTTYRVRQGDSLWTIARRFQVSVADLKRWNRVGRYIRPGDRLTVFIDPDA
jgi:membrane-bound lytic murein transglycosylase D